MNGNLNFANQAARRTGSRRAFALATPREAKFENLKISFLFSKFKFLKTNFSKTVFGVRI